MENELEMKKDSYKWSKKFEVKKKDKSEKKLAEVKDIGCRSKTILMEDTTPRNQCSLKIFLKIGVFKNFAIFIEKICL